MNKNGPKNAKLGIKFFLVIKHIPDSFVLHSFVVLFAIHHLQLMLQYIITTMYHCSGGNEFIYVHLHFRKCIMEKNSNDNIN